ncbi:hypothetical protein GOBAR_DD23252 [Gossypium barbadense]|nr:hypothetical protein GOBAR_DD23252 [Gossypium barbadense]
MPPKAAKSKEASAERPILGRFSSHIKIGIVRKPSSSFTRRGSMIYTNTPTRESLSRNVTDMKGRNGAQSIPMRKKKDKVDKNGSNNQDEKENEELISLREQVEDLQKKLLEKDELLKSAELSKNQINDVRAELGKLKQDAAEKDSLIKSIQLQLSDAKQCYGGSNFASKICSVSQPLSAVAHSVKDALPDPWLK